MDLLVLIVERALGVCARWRGGEGKWKHVSERKNGIDKATRMQQQKNQGHT